MKCWECKETISQAAVVFYLSPTQERPRDVCYSCKALLTFNPCHFVEVEHITGRQLKSRTISETSK